MAEELVIDKIRSRCFPKATLCPESITIEVSNLPNGLYKKMKSLIRLVLFTVISYVTHIVFLSTFAAAILNFAAAFYSQIKFINEYEKTFPFYHPLRGCHCFCNAHYEG